MCAAEITAYGGPEVLQIKSVARPSVTPGTGFVRVHAFGVNCAEGSFRKGVWGDVARVTGIQCAGEVFASSSPPFEFGQRIFALRGGMGRSIAQA
jgi:NADPH:quinone reductase